MEKINFLLLCLLFLLLSGTYSIMPDPWKVHFAQYGTQYSNKNISVTSEIILNFDLSDLQKLGKSKTRVLCHVSLLDVPEIVISNIQTPNLRTWE
jgi:hypothetical protein